MWFFFKWRWTRINLCIALVHCAMLVHENEKSIEINNNSPQILWPLLLSKKNSRIIPTVLFTLYLRHVILFRTKNMAIHTWNFSAWLSVYLFSISLRNFDCSVADLIFDSFIFLWTLILTITTFTTQYIYSYATVTCLTSGPVTLQSCRFGSDLCVVLLVIIIFPKMMSKFCSVLFLIQRCIYPPACISYK